MAATTKPCTAALEVPDSLRRGVLMLALLAVGEQVLNTLIGLANTFLVGYTSPATSTKLGYSSSAANRRPISAVCGRRYVYNHSATCHSSIVTCAF